MEKTELVWFSVSEFKIITAKHVLQEAGITPFTIDKKDSAHAGAFGDIELYVPKEDKEEAYKILVEHGVIIPDESE